MIRTISLLAVLFCAGLAQAQPATNVQRAREHADRGRAALSAGDFRLALEEYRAAYDLYQNPLLLINVAAAHTALGDLEQSILTLRRVLDDSSVDDARKREVTAEVQRLERLLAVLDIQVDPPGARIVVNGADRGTAPLSVVVPAGPVSVAASAEGYRAGRWDNGGASVEVGRRYPVAIDLDAVAVPLQEPTSGRDEHLDPLYRERHGRRRGLSRGWFWGSAVAAGAFAIAGSVFGTMAIVRHASYVEAECDPWDGSGPEPPERPPPASDCADRRATGKAIGALSTGFFIAAGVAAAAAVILYTQSSGGDAEDVAQALNDLGTVHF